MSRASDLIVRIRDVLYDPSGDRWSDVVLLRYLNQGIYNFIYKTDIYRIAYWVKLQTNIALYDLSQYFINISRVEYLDKNIPRKTEYDMDSLNSEWKHDTGLDVKYVVFSNQNQGIFRIYPKIIEDTYNGIVQNSLYGGLIDIEITDGLFEQPSPEEFESTTYKYLTVFGIGKPSTIDISSDDLFIPAMYDEALIYYVTGSALRIDSDSQNRSFGAEQLQLYESIVKLAIANSSYDYSSVPTTGTHYKGFL